MESEEKRLGKERRDGLDRREPRPKLTQYLIDKGYINEAECSRALERQVMFGGRFGTNLLELCVITEAQLLEAISVTSSVPVVDTRHFEISRELIDEFPAEMALKYKIIPLFESKGQLHVVMLDYQNVQIIDEISFKLGKSIKPHITTEMEVHRLLKEYYGADVDRRFLILPKEHEKRKRQWEAKHGVKPSIKETEPPPFSGEGSDLSEEAPNDVPVTEKPPPLNYTEYNDCLNGLADAKDREDIVDVLMGYSKSQMDCVVFLEVKGEDVYGWKADGMWDTPEKVAELKFSIHEESVIRHVTKTGMIFIGPMNDTPVHRNILESLGGMMPEEILAIPILARKEIISVLIGNNSHSHSEFRDIQVLKNLVHKAGMAFDMLIQRAEILFK
jgi:hypothetical protein